MSDVGPESFSPGEGASAAPEQVSEEAKQRFAAAAAAMQAIQREEKRSKKRDSRVARTIVQFLNDERYTHLFVLISRLVARDCPSIFIIGILSLISEESRLVVVEYLQEMGQQLQTVPRTQTLARLGEVDAESNALLIDWITRMQMILSIETKQILVHLLVDEHNIDGTVLQLTTFVVQDFFQSSEGGKRKIPFEKLHLFSASILQTVFEPFLDSIDRSLLRTPKNNSEDDDQ